MLLKEKLLFICVFIIGLASLITYFVNFHSGFSSDSSDWGSFGSYLAGTVTIPFSFLTLYFVYKTYVATEQTLTKNIISSKMSEAHAAIKEASDFIEVSLDSSVKFHGGELTFRDMHIDPNNLEPLIHEAHFRNRYRISVGKPLICLYDFLSSAEKEFGITPTVKFYKIRHQWLINVHNRYEVNIIDLSRYGLTPKEMEDFFYRVD